MCVCLCVRVINVKGYLSVRFFCDRLDPHPHPCFEFAEGFGLKEVGNICKSGLTISQVALACG